MDIATLRKQAADAKETADRLHIAARMATVEKELGSRGWMPDAYFIADPAPADPGAVGNVELNPSTDSILNQPTPSPGAWSALPPTKAGSYWWRPTANDAAETRNVYHSHGPCWSSLVTPGDECQESSLKSVGGEWWSIPIPAPGTPAANEVQGTETDGLRESLRIANKRVAELECGFLKVHQLIEPGADWYSWQRVYQNCERVLKAADVLAQCLMIYPSQHFDGAAKALNEYAATRFRAPGTPAATAGEIDRLQRASTPGKTEVGS